MNWLFFAILECLIPDLDLSVLHHLKWLNVNRNQIKEFDLHVWFDPETGLSNQSLLTLDIAENNLINLGCLSEHSNLEKLVVSGMFNP